jgi:uncharacterized protein (TIGR02996 family)
MTDDELALLAAVLSDPGDDTPRLVYADWLDENADERCHKCDGAGTQPCPTTPDFSQTCSACWGKSSGRRDRAEFIRVQCELAKWAAIPSVSEAIGRGEIVGYAEHSERIHDLRRREGELLKSHGDEWFGVDLHDENRDTTEPLPPLRTSRGFVEYVACSWEAWVATYAPAVYWRAEVACPRCPSFDTAMRLKMEDDEWVCWGCKGIYRVPNPGPPPPTAQPVARVVFPFAGDIPDGMIEAGDDFVRGVRKFAHPDYPGITFERPVAMLPTHPHHGIGQSGTGFWGPSSH